MLSNDRLPYPAQAFGLNAQIFCYLVAWDTLYNFRIFFQQSFIPVFGRECEKVFLPSCPGQKQLLGYMKTQVT